MMPRCSTAKAKLAAGLACFAVHVTGIPALQAQTFPTQTVRIVVGAAVSSPSDVLSRILATEVQAAEKWTVVIENTPGGNARRNRGRQI